MLSVAWALQQSVGGAVRCCSMYCVLSAGSLDCYFTPEEITAKLAPSQQIAVNKVSGKAFHKEPLIFICFH